MKSALLGLVLATACGGSAVNQSADGGMDPTPIIVDLAYAETVIDLGGGTCALTWTGNAYETICTVPNTVGDVITFTYAWDTGAVTLTVTDVVDTTAYAGQMQWGERTTNTNYLQITPFVVELTPSATLTGNLRKTRSGSGIGGWAWHTHWDFQTLTIQ
jgi:hypothetical protein